jgi:hypothetical protein
MTVPACRRAYRRSPRPNSSAFHRTMQNGGARACSSPIRLAARVTFATLGPPQDRPHSNLGQVGEHALAFVLVGLALRACLPAPPTASRGDHDHRGGGDVLESLQLFVPGRHARIGDLIVDVLTALAGFAIVAAIDFAAARGRPAKPD